MAVMDEQAVFEKVKAALEAFLERDGDLLDAKASERAMSHKLAEHLQQHFDDFQVDCEYNRHIKDIKRLMVWCKRRTSLRALQARTVFPDIIVHRRGRDECNLLVIEVKKSNSNRDHWLDFDKLKGFTGEEYGYTVGLFLILDVKKGCVGDVRSFRKGRQDGRDTEPWAKLKEFGCGK